MNQIDDTIKFLLENGLIFEFNRQVLHPIGLALEVDLEEDEYGKERPFLKLWQCPKENVEGFLYPPDSFDIGKEKYNKFLKDSGAENRTKERQNVVGFLIQEKSK